MAAHPEQKGQDGREADSPSGDWSFCPLSIIRRLFSLYRLPLRVSERRLLLTALDLLAVNGGLLLALALRPGYSLDWGLFIHRPLWFLLLSVLWLSLAYAFDAYDLRVAGRFSTAAPAVLKAAALSAAIYLLIPYLPPALPASRLSLFAFFLFIFLLLLIGRGFYILALAQPYFRRPTLIVGAGWAGRVIAQVLAEHGSVYQVVGFVDDDPEKQGMVVTGREGDRETGEQRSRGAGEHGRTRPRAAAPQRPSTLAPPLVLGDRHTLLELIAEHRIATLVLAITHEVHSELLQMLVDALEMGVEIIPMPVLYEQLTGKLPVEHIGDNWYVALPLHHLGTSNLWPMAKRLTDVVLSSVGLLLLGLASPFIAAAIYLDSPGPIFYTQERVGKGGRIFRLYKFRSMVPNAEQGKAVWAQENDQRVTRVGRILRRTHVDEFPQFLNILKGDMSAVGPRPERPEFVEQLAAEIPLYRVRHAVRPGMAGWGLVKEGYGASREEALLKLQCDLYYIKYQSMWLDLEILLKTIVDVVSLGGR